MPNITIKDKEFSVEEMQKMIDAGIAFGEKHDVFQASPGAQVPHGLMYNMNVAGLFTRPGAEMGMFSTITAPDGMWLSRLMTEPTLILNPEYDILTGVRDCVGNNAANGCAQPPTAGALKLCTTSNRFGEINMGTDQVQINKIGGRLNRADVDKSVMNNPMIYPLMPDVVRSATNINTQLGMSMVSLGITIQRWLTRTVFHGVWGTAPANTYCGFTKWFDGFDRLIRTGYLDVVSGNHCTAADSKIINWANNGTCDTLNGYTLYDTFAYLFRYLEEKAEMQGLLPTEWVIAMHPDLFNALIECVPCDFFTHACNMRDDNTERTVDGMATVQMREEMRQGKFLPILGQRIPVWTTTAIAQTAYGAGLRSDIYIIPLNSIGFKTTHLEWFDQNNADIREYVGVMQGAIDYTTMNNGLWAVTEMQTRMCLEYHFAAQPRLVMRTPQLAARITNVVASAPFDLYTDDPYPGTAYHKDGGRYYTPGPYYGGDWVGDQVLR